MTKGDIKYIAYSWYVVSHLYLSVVIEALQYIPPPVPVLGVLGESVHVEETFHCLWSQQVVSVCRLEENTLNQY